LLHGGIQVILAPYTNDKLTIMDLAQVVYKPIAHFWFLQALFFCFLIYAVLKKYFPIAVLIFISLALYVGKFFLGPGLLNNVCRMFLFFVMGSIFVPISTRVRDDIDGLKMILIGLSFFTFQIAIFQFHVFDQAFVKLLAAFAGIGFVITLSVYIYSGIYTRNRRNIISDILKQLGFMAMPIYLAHAMASAAARIILGKVFHVQDIGVHLFLGCLSGIIFPVLLFVVTQRLGFPWLFTLSKTSALSQRISSYGFGRKSA
jgi:hypothetical protein